MSVVVYGTFCNPANQFGLSFYCKGATVCDVFRNFTAVQCLSQPGQLYCTNQHACSGANFTNDIYVEYPYNGRTATDYDTITRKAFAFNQTIPIAAYNAPNTARREVEMEETSQIEVRAATPAQQVLRTFEKIYGGPKNPSNILVNALASTLFNKQGSKGGTKSVAALQIKLRDALFAAVQSSTPKAITQVKKCKEVNATMDGMVAINNQYIGNITKFVAQNTFATWMLTNFVAHTIANVALASEVVIIKSVVKSSLSSCSSSPSTTTMKPTKSSSSSTSTPTPTAGCNTIFSLSGASELAFNPAGKGFSASLPCAALNVSSIAVLANFEEVTNYTATASSISFAGFSQPEVLLAIFAQDTAGNPIINSFQLLFGSDTLPVTVLTANGKPAISVNVKASGTLYTDVTQDGTTNSNGQVTFINLPGTTVGLVAHTADGQLAVNGVASSVSQVTMTLIPFGTPSNVSNWDFSHGIDGWSGGTISTHVEKRQDYDLSLSSNGDENVQTSSGTFDAFPFTTRMYVRYRFQTNEIPGGYFGSQFNDYYSVSIRSNTSEYISVTNSMNALGRGAFDDNGYTDWFTLQLLVPKGVAKSGHVDIAVANVGDDRVDSEIIIDKAGDIDCDDCTQCSTCPSEPMCQQACTNPPGHSCAFYANCVEATVPCKGTSHSYAINYGDYYCNKYRANLDEFSPQGQQFIEGTANCLQRALAPSVTCKASCASIETAAYDSHPKCYVDNGFCDLPCWDYAFVGITVFGGLLSVPGFNQAFTTKGLCGQLPPDAFDAASCKMLPQRVRDTLHKKFSSYKKYIGG